MPRATRDRPRDFDELIRILDHDLRLITPTEHREGRRWGRSDAAIALIGELGSDPVLPAHPRLPGAFAPRLADAQAAGDAPGPGRAAAGRACVTVGSQSRRTGTCPAVIEWVSIRAADPARRTGPNSQRRMMGGPAGSTPRGA